MPINTYTGLMGSGKSYECVSSVIVPAVKAGRCVVIKLHPKSSLMIAGLFLGSVRSFCGKILKNLLLESIYAAAIWC